MIGLTNFATQRFALVHAERGPRAIGLTNPQSSTARSDSISKNSVRHSVRSCSGWS